MAGLLLILGALLIGAGFFASMFIVQGVGAELYPDLFYNLRTRWEQFLFVPTEDFGWTIKAALTFGLLMAPGTILLSAGKDLNSKKPAPKE